MDFKVENFRCQALKEGKFVKPCFATYMLNKEERNWEIVKASDSVAILIYNEDSNAFVCVKQFRPAVYMQDKETNGVTVELCAGILDKDLTLEETASEEILEECGFRVEPSDLEKITSFYTSVGFAGSKQHLYFAKVNESMRISSGGGVAGEEMIEVIEIPLPKTKEFMFDESTPKTPGLLFAFNWFFLQVQR